MFIDRAVEVWGDKYDYSQVQYVNSRTRVKIYCRKHNFAFYQTPKAHFTAKHNCCPLCVKEVMGTFQNQWREDTPESENENPAEKYDSLLSKVFC